MLQAPCGAVKLSQHPACSPCSAPRGPRAAAGRRRLAASGTAGIAPAPQRVVCAAATEQGRDSRAGGHRAGSAEGANATSSSNGWGGGGNPLLQRIAASSTASQLHNLLLRHSGELSGLEVAAALETAAKRSLLSPAEHTDAVAPGGRPHDGSSSSGTSSGAASSALASLLVQLASLHAPRMDPAALSAAAWSLGMLQLAPARPVLRTMHALAQAGLVQYSPAQLCALLWAGSALDPTFHSPLFLDLAGLLQRGMSLSLFAPHDLAMLAWLCGRVGWAWRRAGAPHSSADCGGKVQQAAAAADVPFPPWISYQPAAVQASPFC